MYFVYIETTPLSDYDDAMIIPIAIFDTFQNLVDFAKSLSNDKLKATTRYNTGTWISEYWYMKININENINFGGDGECLSNLVNKID